VVEELSDEWTSFEKIKMPFRNSGMAFFYFSTDEI